MRAQLRLLFPVSALVVGLLACANAHKEAEFVEGYRDRMCACPSADCARQQASAFRLRAPDFTAPLSLPDAKRVAVAATSAARCCMSATRWGVLDKKLTRPDDLQLCNYTEPGPTRAQ